MKQTLKSTFEMQVSLYMENKTSGINSLPAYEKKKGLRMCFALKVKFALYI